MKRTMILISTLLLAASLAACGGQTAGTADPTAQPEATTAPAADTTAEEQAEASAPVTELYVRFGDSGAVYPMTLEDNPTAAAIAGYVGQTSWRLPVYSYDESDVMEYYDVPSRYEIPDDSVSVTEAHAGEVYYSDPNRIVLYYRDAAIDEEYTLIGHFDATEEFVDSVENNPVLEGWGNQIIVISTREGG